MVKSLVIYYSRDGSTRKVAESVASSLGCDIEEVRDTANRTGISGYILAGRDASLGKLTIIEENKEDPESYDLIIVGTPIWAWTVSPPIRTYLTKYKGKIKKTAFFCTMGGSGATKAFLEMEKISGIKPLATLELTTREAKADSYQPKVVKFADDALKAI